jgi:hypothetical protein
MNIYKYAFRLIKPIFKQGVVAMGKNNLKVLSAILLIIIIALSSFIWLSINKSNELQNQNNASKKQVDNLQYQNSQLQDQINASQNRLNEIENQTDILQNQSKMFQNQNSVLQSQNNDLKNQIIALQNQTSPSQTSTTITPSYAARIYNFSSLTPNSVVFTVTEYDFTLTVQNTGNVTIKNMTLDVKLILADGESSNTFGSSPINELGVGEIQQISGWATIQNLVTNIYGLHTTWLFTLRIPALVLAQQTY